MRLENCGLTRTACLRQFQISRVNGDGVNVRDASYALNFSRFDKIKGFDLLYYRTKEENLASSKRG
jgi:hypothetical protein